MSQDPVTTRLLEDLKMALASRAELQARVERLKKALRGILNSNTEPDMNGYSIIYVHDDEYAAARAELEDK